MGLKLNFSKKKDNKKIALVLKLVLGLIVAYFVAKGLKNAINEIKKDKGSDSNVVAELQYNIKAYNSLESLLLSHNCKFISQENYNKINKIMVSFPFNLYTDDISNEHYFYSLCKIIAEYLDFANFELIDSSKKINIKVMCVGSNIAEFKVNDDNNYFLNHDSEINLKKIKKPITTFYIESPELLESINNGWVDSQVNWGTKESTCNGYNIFFDEGISYKVVARNIYNIIFTKNYEGNIVSGLNVNSQKEEVKAVLGEPTLISESNLYGYLGENNYLFFDFSNQEISIYPVIKTNYSDIEKLSELIEKMNKDSNVKSFITDLTELWIDYDVYNFDSTYVDLRYTLKGISINLSSSSLKNGIYIYQNFSENRDIVDLENVYMQSDDMIVKAEKERSLYDSISHTIEGEEFEDEVGSLFRIIYKDAIRKKGPQFYSLDGRFPDSELDSTLEMSSFKWVDDFTLLYSVDYEGLYMYNAGSRNNRLIQEKNEKIKINSFQDGIVIFNEKEQLLLDN